VGFGQVANTVLHLRAAEEGFKRADRKQSMEVLTPRHDAAERSASVVGCVFAMLATIVGGGALSLPYALKSLGVPKGLAILAVAAVASDLSLLALCSASRRTGIVALPQLARHTHGKKAEVLCSVSLLVLCAFVAVAYVSLLRDMLALATGLDDGRVLYFCLIFVLLPLSLFHDVSRLSFAAVVSFCAAILVSATFAMRAPAALDRGGAGWADLVLAPGEAPDAFAALGAVPIVSILYLCQFNILSVHSRLHDPTRDRLKTLVHTAVGLSTLLYVVLGLAGLAVCRDVPLDDAQDALAGVLFRELSTEGTSSLGRRSRASRRTTPRTRSWAPARWPLASRSSSTRRRSSSRSATRSRRCPRSSAAPRGRRRRRRGRCASTSARGSRRRRRRTRKRHPCGRARPSRLRGTTSC
jgi:hypothetical protein